MWELAKIASVEYPLLDHRDLLRLCSCNVGRQRISASWDRLIANSFISGIVGSQGSNGFSAETAFCPKILMSNLK